MGFEEDSAARRFVNAARLHADETVLDQIEPANAIGLAQLVQLCQQGRRGHLHVVDGDRIALLEINRNLCHDVGRIFR